MTFTTSDSLPFPIAETVHFGPVEVVRLDVPAGEGTKMNGNVFGIDQNGHVLWQIPVPSLAGGSNSPYTSIEKDGDALRAFNWCGVIMVVSPIDGRVLKEEWEK